MSKQPVLTNFYEHIPREYRDGASNVKYKTYDKVKINVPMRMLVVGSSGSGKTNTVMNLITTMSAWTKIYLTAKCLTEPLYQFLIDKMNELGEKTGKELIVCSDNVDDLPELSELDPDESTLFIFDDLVTEGTKAQKRIAELFVRGRKYGASCIYITQSYFATPSLIRRNCDYLILKKIATGKDLKAVLREYNLGDVSEEDLILMYKRVLSKGFENFLMIDLNTNDESLKFRFNFSPLF